MGDYRKLLVWQKAHALAVNVVSVANRVRGAAYAPLKSQMVRAAMSIPANLVEGCVLKSPRDYLRFVKYAVGSAAELEYHLLIAKDIRVISAADYHSLSSQLTEIRKMLHGLSKTLNKLATKQLTN